MLKWIIPVFIKILFCFMLSFTPAILWPTLSLISISTQFLFLNPFPSTVLYLSWWGTIPFILDANIFLLAPYSLSLTFSFYPPPPSLSSFLLRTSSFFFSPPLSSTLSLSLSPALSVSLGLLLFSSYHFLSLRCLFSFHSASTRKEITQAENASHEHWYVHTQNIGWNVSGLECVER